MRDLVIASHNPGKVKEIREALSGLAYRVIGPEELPSGLPEVVEDGQTLLENAQKKARSAVAATGALCLADDTGLEVEALEGAPGVYSARWAGPGCTYDDNNRKLLSELARLSPQAPRRAMFRTVMVLAEPKREDWVAGWVHGEMARQARGNAGFGYDPVFYLPDKRKTFAELSLQEKNRLSHRGQALARIRVMLERW